MNTHSWRSQIPRGSSYRPATSSFVRPQLDPRQAVDDAILAVGNATIQWMRAHGFQVPTNETSVHVALAWRNGSSLIFVEATPPAVRLTRATDFWKASGRARRRSTTRSCPPTRSRAMCRSVRSNTPCSKSTPYSYGFSPPPSAFYCSSLVEWSLSASRVHLTRLHQSELPPNFRSPGLLGALLRQDGCGSFLLQTRQDPTLRCFCTAP